MDRGAWWATVPEGHNESNTTQGLNNSRKTKKFFSLFLTFPLIIKL